MVVWLSVPIVAVRVTVYVPGLRLLALVTMRTLVADPPGDRETLDGFRDNVGPVERTVAVRETLPVRPLMLVSVRVELDELPGGISSELGFAESVKSTT